jgi:hypothetical protein
MPAPPSGSTINPADGLGDPPLPRRDHALRPHRRRSGHARSSRAAMPGDAEVPLEWMPPGTAAGPLPERGDLPAADHPDRFNHKKHVKEQLKLSCQDLPRRRAHERRRERSAYEPAQACRDGCHETDHTDSGGAGDSAAPVMGQCAVLSPGAGGEAGKGRPW